jgi:hypothetical protein
MRVKATPGDLSALLFKAVRGAFARPPRARSNLPPDPQLGLGYEGRPSGDDAAL